MTYDPEDWDGKHALPKLYSRTASGAINTWEIWLDKAGGVVVRWGQMDGALQTSVFQCERKNVGRANATSMVQQSRLEAIAKWRKQVKKKYYVSLSDAMATTCQSRLRPMLAKKLEDRLGKFQYPVDTQPKLDGVRCLAQCIDGRVQLYSRGGDPYDVQHVSLSLVHGLVDEDVVLDGEIYVHGMSLQNIISLVTRPQEASLQLTYNIYDIASTAQEEPWELRKGNLQSWFEWAASGELLGNCIKAVPTSTASSLGELKTAHDYYVQAGYEGAMIRLPDGIYRFGCRSSELLKMKEFDDSEFKLTGWRRGKGKFENVPIFECTMKSGATFDVTPRGTEEVRAELLATAKSLLGKMYTVRYFGLTDEGIPRFPVGIGVREKGM